MPLAEVMRLLASTGQTGMLTIFVQREQLLYGRIYFSAGQIIHGEANQVTGLDALLQLARAVNADFAFEEHGRTTADSLAAYPPQRLMEQVHRTTDEMLAFYKAMPSADDTPIYTSKESELDFEASPEDLSLLLLCRGRETVVQIAQSTGRTVEDIAYALARFRLAGLIECQAHPIPAAEVPEPPPKPEPTKKLPRLWRGKPIE